MNTTPPANGDRIRLIAMGDDPEPIQIGQIGTVVEVARYGAGKSAWFHCTIEDVYHGLVVTVDPTDPEVTVPDNRGFQTNTIRWRN